MNNEEIKDTNPKKRNLVLGLTKDLRIVQFDIQCQKITGYTRDEIIQNNPPDMLIPTRFIKEWHEQLKKISLQGSIENVEIPWKTKNGKEIIIKWNGFPLDKKNTDQLYCLIGTPITNSQVIKQSSKHIIEKQNIPSEQHIQNPDRKEDVVERTRIIPLSSQETMIQKPNNFPVDTFNKTTNHTKNVPKEGILKKNTKESDTMKKIVDDLSKKYDVLNKKFKDLDKKNRELERNNKLLEKNLNTLNNSETATPNEQKIYMVKKIKQKESVHSKKISINIRDPFGFKRKKDEIHYSLQLLDAQKKELSAKESELLKERKEIDQKIAEFSSWKEKLLLAEEEIEKRRNVLLEQETLLQQKIDTVSEQNELTATTDLTKTNDSDEHPDILESISDCAAVIQRGILKQVNVLFSDLIGFSTEELLDKSLFDFIAPEGLPDIEHYYLNRLKGNDISNYITVFSTKNNEKISAEVHLKPTVFHGEKAEITVIKQIKKETELEEKKEK